MKKNKGFTLIELMIVIAIIGILGVIGYPSYIKLVEKGNRGDAIDSLLSLSGRMEDYFDYNDTYAGATINGAGTGTVGSNKTSDDLYILRIVKADGFYYKLRAKPKGDDAECGNLFLDSTGKKTTSKGVSANCW